jgi:hypothetical protein
MGGMGNNQLQPVPRLSECIEAIDAELSASEINNVHKFLPNNEITPRQTWGYIFS